MSASKVKPCVKCGSTERYPSGRCRPCKLATGVRWATTNRERANETKAKWSAANPDKCRASEAKYRDENRAKCRERILKCKVANAKAVREYNAKWRSTNPEKLCVYSHNYRARQHLAGGTLSHGLVRRLLKLQQGKCPACQLPLGDDYHRDHIMPLALGGANEDWNIQLLHGSCNQQKNAKHPVDFMQSRGFLL